MADPDKPWMRPIQYTDEPEPAFQSLDTEPMDYSRGPHDAIIGEIPEDERAAQRQDQRPEQRVPGPPRIPPRQS